MWIEIDPETGEEVPVPEGANTGTPEGPVTSKESKRGK